MYRISHFVVFIYLFTKKSRSMSTKTYSTNALCSKKEQKKNEKKGNNLNAEQLAMTLNMKRYI